MTGAIGAAGRCAARWWHSDVAHSVSTPFCGVAFMVSTNSGFTSMLFRKTSGAGKTRFYQQ